MNRIFDSQPLALMDGIIVTFVIGALSLVVLEVEKYPLRDRSGSDQARRSPQDLPDHCDPVMRFCSWSSLNRSMPKLSRASMTMSLGVLPA